MQTNEVAKRYAAALAATGKVDLSAVEADLKAVQSSFVGSAQVQNFFVSPRIDGASKKKILAKAFSNKVSDLTLNFLSLLVDKRREDQLSAIYNEFVALNDKALGRIRVEVVLSRDLMQESDDDALYKEVKSTILAKRADFGIAAGDDVELIIDKKVNPDILGGMIIRVGDYLLNASVRRYVNKWTQNISIKKFNVEKIWQE